MEDKLDNPMQWENVDGARVVNPRLHYTVMRAKRGTNGMAVLRRLFPDADANELNFVLFSTSGVHGSYNTIESAERSLNGDQEARGTVTFLVVHPRLVSLRYGVCDPANQDDIEFLKQLRKNSQKAIAEIGVEPPL